MTDYLFTYSKKLFAEAALIKAGRIIPTRQQGAQRALSELDLIMRRRPAARIQLSILIPTYNRPDLVMCAVESAVNQACHSCELIIVNDGGVSLSESCLQYLESVERPVTIVNHRRNLGLGATRNTAAYFSSGEWLLMLDDDDELVPDGPQRLLEIGTASAWRFIHGDHLRRYFDGAGNSSREEYVARGDDPFDLLHFENWIANGTFIIRRDLFFELNGYREDFVVHEDYNLHIRASASTTFRYLPVPVFTYNCRSRIARLNLDKRLFWFSTSMLNHAVYSCFFHCDRGVQRRQTEGEYEHLQRALNEGASPEIVADLVASKWRVLLECGLGSEIEDEIQIIRNLCPAIGGEMERFKP